MKKALFFTVFLPLLFPFLTLAQSQFTLQPIPAIGTGAVEDYDVAVSATITNLTADVLNLSWERQVISLTPGCLTSISDPYLGWLPLVNGKNLDLMPNETGPLIVHFYNNSAPCSGVIHLKITNRNNPLDTLIGVYLFNQNSGVKGDRLTAQVKLYLDPESSFFSLLNSKEVATIRILGLDGREMARMAFQESNIYPLGLLPAGQYVMVLEDKNEVPFQVIAFLKQ